MKTTTNTENLQQYKSRFSLIAEQILTFASGTNLVREVSNLSLISNELHSHVHNSHSDKKIHFILKL